MNFLKKKGSVGSLRNSFLADRHLSIGSLEFNLNLRLREREKKSQANTQNTTSLSIQEVAERIKKAEEQFDPSNPPRTKASSFRSLWELLSDNVSIPYLLQFMESKGAHHLLRFWLEADMFHKSSLVLRQGSQLTQRRQNAKRFEALHADPLSPGDESRPEEDQLQVRVYTDSIGQDAFNIYKKFIASDATQPIEVDPIIRDEIIDCISQEHVDGNCFIKAQKEVFRKMDDQYYTDFVRSPFYTQRQIDLLTSSMAVSGPAMVDILANDGCLFYLMEFSEEIGVRHLIDFLIVADNFSTHTSAVDAFAAEEAQKDAMVIYDKFFSLQAETPIGFSNGLRSKIEEAICSEDGPDAEAFALPFAIVVSYLEKDFLQLFFNSALYQKYLTECIQLVQKSPVCQEAFRRASETKDKDGAASSDGSSSVNQQHQQQSQQGFGSKEMTDHLFSDAARSTSADLVEDKGMLGRGMKPTAPNRLSLQLLHVDPLGKVTSEFEPEPDAVNSSSSGESTISKLKKLVGRPDRLDEEEQAWEVAQQLIHEVQSLTSPTTANNNNNNINNL